VVGGRSLGSVAGGQKGRRPNALAEFEDIFRCILRVSGSPDLARRYVEPMRARCRLIPTLPQAGRPRHDLAPGRRSVPIERRIVIIYRVVGETVEITNIFPGARNYAGLYRRGEAKRDD
jgi:toxin ParE1/3/4